MRSFLVAVAGLAALGATASPAWAVTYSIALTASEAGFSGGSGSFEAASTADGQQQDAARITVEDITFTGPATVFFRDGTVMDFLFNRETGLTPNRYALQISNTTYSFAYDDEQRSTTGTFAVAATAVPEPASLALLGGGLLGAGLFRRRRSAA